MVKRRVPAQVSERFMKRLKDLQRKIRMKYGEEESLGDLTEKMATSIKFDELEKSILEKGELKLDLKVKFDGRIF